jgi:hypothetical protein
MGNGSSLTQTFRLVGEDDGAGNTAFAYLSCAINGSVDFGNDEVGTGTAGNVNIVRAGTTQIRIDGSINLRTSLRPDSGYTTIDLGLPNQPFAEAYVDEIYSYNSYTDASNYERGVFKWDTNELVIGTESLGTGTDRALRFLVNGIDYGGITTVGRWQFGVGAGSGNTVNIGGDRVIAITGGNGFLRSLNGNLYLSGNGSTTAIELNNSEIRLWSFNAGGAFNLRTSNVTKTTMILEKLTSQTAAMMVVRDVGGAGNDWLNMNSSGAMTIDQDLTLNNSINISGTINQQTSSAADPTTTEFANDGDWGIHENTTSGNIYLAFNNGGVIVKTQLT